MTRLRKRFITIGLVSILALVLCAAPAYAYFTALVSASGEQEINLGYETQIEEGKEGTDKVITIENKGETDVKVRVQVFYPTGIEGITIAVSAPSGWTCVNSTEGQQTWEYDAALKAGKTTDPALRVDVNGALSEEGAAEFDVTVVSQSSPVYYSEDGATAYGYLWNSGR